MVLVRRQPAVFNQWSNARDSWLEMAVRRSADAVDCRFAMTLPLLEMSALTIGYRGARPIATDLTASLAQGELVCLLGPNGAGKSTLMRTLAGMQPALHGDVLVAGEPLALLTPRELARRISVVLTDRVQTWILSAYDLVALGRHPYTDWAGRLTETDHERVRWALATVGAEDLSARPVSELSDGERQKVMVARALAQEPRIMLLDEITAFLDLPRRVDIMTTLRTLAHESGRALLLSTHDLDLALRTADRIWLLARGGAFHVGTPEHLVLSGAFEDAFRSEGIDFDRGSGSFRVHRHAVGRATIVGEGLHAAWMARAVERIGYDVVAPGVQADVIVELTEGTWRCRMGRERWSSGTIDEVLERLQHP
jgi:iron complex transport system ATP-binding protein